MKTKDGDVAVEPPDSLDRLTHGPAGPDDPIRLSFQPGDFIERELSFDVVTDGTPYFLRWGIVAVDMMFSENYVEDDPAGMIPQDTRNRVTIPIHSDARAKNTGSIFGRIDSARFDLEQKTHASVKVENGQAGPGEDSVLATNPVIGKRSAGIDPEDPPLRFTEDKSQPLWKLVMRPEFEGEAHARDLSFAYTETGSTVVIFHWAICWSPGGHVEVNFKPEGYGLGVDFAEDTLDDKFDDRLVEIRGELFRQAYFWSLNVTELDLWIEIARAERDRAREAEGGLERVRGGEDPAQEWLNLLEGIARDVKAHKEAGNDPVPPTGISNEDLADDIEADLLEVHRVHERAMEEFLEQSRK